MTAATTIPGYVVGTWDIDPVHSDVAFVVRHMMVSKVRGRFEKVSGELVTAERLEDSTVTATIDASSITTGNDQRRPHPLRRLLRGREVPGVDLPVHRDRREG